ncbi:MAG: N-acetylmuramoyl-L-alanine amidase [Flavobacteriaceae bacterium]|jgi:N-acetylmuramoyl-L-alanine amidase|nr:N-acetylmuramoyl-L-alanine amidase [Flavobacteriaceae bacterium]
MNKIKALGIPKIKALGLNNLSGVENPPQKSLKIRYLSFVDNGFFLTLEFEIVASKLNLDKNTVILSVYRKNKPIYDVGLSQSIKISNGISKVKFSFNKMQDSVEQAIALFGNTKEYYAVIVADGLSARTEFDLSSKKEIKNEKYKKIKIVLDPGHGYTKGNTGAVCYLYKYKIKGNDGLPELDSNNNPVIKEGDIMNIPQYVINEPDAWIISKKEDPNYNERILVFDVSSKLKELLEKKGFTCFITRDSKVIIGNDDVKTRMKRIDLANKNKADYFISIHADGSKSNNSTGSHVIYPKMSDENIRKNCKELATDIFTFYNVVNVEKSSPKEDERELQVLGSSNYTPKKILVELGFVTTPKDANSLFSNIDRIAQQLFDGIMKNVEKYY